ncbi:TIR domain-containing protein [Listeria booriae]|uniref:TIR domain-containing protein n=1 Tax=Listeria booriae TaxID=1552123 RepID=UPI001629075B|nr:TIR domain-containing protein [Listeria booriae]MBC1284384.1 TIR domain-containing protein [Listeria booriae]
MAKLFVSYHHKDESYKNLLKAWSANDNGHFDIKFDDTSVGVSINSENATYIKSVIKTKIKESPDFLCLIGKDTHKSDWVAWEIDTAVDLKKNIIAVKIDNGNTAPSNILGVGASWAKSFTYDSIKKAIDD